MCVACRWLPCGASDSPTGFTWQEFEVFSDGPRDDVCREEHEATLLLTVIVNKVTVSFAMKRLLAASHKKGATFLLKLTSWRPRAHLMSFTPSLMFVLLPAPDASGAYCTKVPFHGQGRRVCQQDLPVPANEGCSGLEAHLGRSDALVKALLNPKKLEAFITEKLCGSDRLRG